MQITRRAPRGRLPYTLAGPVMRLAPTWPERKIEDSPEFVSAYPARLSGVGGGHRPAATVGLPTGRLVVLCFEKLEGIPEA